MGGKGGSFGLAKGVLWVRDGQRKVFERGRI